MFSLPDLPYAYDALEPVVSAETLRLHHDKHHAAYVRATNERMPTTAARWPNLEAVIAGAAAASDTKLFDNAAQAWNHAFYWRSMSPNHEQPTGHLHATIRSAFGGLAELRQVFVDAGADHFGSGWVWLAADLYGKLQVLTTHDAGCLLTYRQMTPLLVADLWEHAYYVDYRNDRRAHLEAWFDTLPNWSLAATQLAASQSNTSRWGYPPPSRLVTTAW